MPAACCGWRATPSWSRAAARGITIDADALPDRADGGCRRSRVHRHGAQPAGQCRHLHHRQPHHPVGQRPARPASPWWWKTTAHGVAPEDLARIQEPFEHAGRGEAAQHSKGAGLGLTLVKAFAELHGGWLELDSRPGRGLSRHHHAAPGRNPTASCSPRISPAIGPFAPIQRCACPGSMAAQFSENFNHKRFNHAAFLNRSGPIPSALRLMLVCGRRELVSNLKKQLSAQQQARRHAPRVEARMGMP